ncbi:putative inactive purple acid phosphatase 27 [Glycine soja]
MSMSCMYRVQMRIYAVVGYVCCRERIPNSAVHDWVGVFSPANFNSSTCLYTGGVGWYKYANHSNSKYMKTRKAILKFQLINQRADFSFGLFSGGLSNPRLVAVSNSISFANPKAPVYPRLALGRSWDEMTVTWTSGYDIDEGLLLNGVPKEKSKHTLLEKVNLQELLASVTLTSPYPGQNSLQRVIIFGDMGKVVYTFECSSRLSVMVQINMLIINLICLMQMDTPHSETNSQLKCKKFRQHGNHERDWPNTGSLFDTPDSGGECGVFAETMYKADYGLFRFCVADSEHDWREGSEQYKFIEHCLATIDRKHQPWLIFSAHRPLDYSSNDWYGKEGSFEEPMGRESLQKLWQKYKVEIPFYGHVHNYERMCPIYQNQCVNQEKHQLLWHCERNNSCGCWWWGKSLVRLHTNTPYLESLQGSLDYGFGKLTGIQSFISLILFAIQRYGGGMLYAALPLHMQRGCFRIRTHDQQVTKAQLYRCTRYSTVEADSLGCLTVVTNMRS